MSKATKKAFYGDRISNNMTKTPEGYLICHNVPIARTGTQEYTPEEIGIQGTELISVMREEAEVFSSATLASFEGKPVTNEHPEEDVTASNYVAYTKGHTTNIRRGNGSESDKILADLVIYDISLISEIESGKKEVSCGYDCVYETDDSGKIYQTNIRGNHVAVVDKGRAGNEVKIKDKKPENETKPENERRISFMAKKREKGIIEKILSFAKDADPSEVAEVIEVVTELQDSQSEDNEPTADNAEDTGTSDTIDNSEALSKLQTSLDEVLKRLSALETNTQKTPELDELSKLEDELNEESVTVPVEEIDEDTTSDESATEDEESTDEDSASDEGTTKSNDSALKLIRDMKPMVANIKDPKERKRATDALVKAARGLQAKPKKENANGYRKIMDAKQAHAKTLSGQKGYDYNSLEEKSIGLEIAKQRNPHYKN